MIYSKQVIILFFTCLLFNWSYSQNKKKVSIPGTYCKSETFSGICLELRPDSTYKYTSGDDLETWYSVGKWSKKKDTIILNSFIQANNLPISIIEQVSNTTDSLIFFPLPENLSGNLMKNISIYTNYDSTKSCMPAFENDCKFLKEKTYSIKVTLSDKISSKWQKINSTRPDTLKIKVNVTDNLELFIFMDNERFLLTKSTIIPLEKSDETRSNLKYERMNYTLTKNGVKIKD